MDPHTCHQGTRRYTVLILIIVHVNMLCSYFSCNKSPVYELMYMLVCVIKWWWVKLLPNFTSIPFDYLLISWVTNYLSNRGFLTCLSSVILDRIDRSWTPLSQTFRAEIWLKFSEFFDNIPLRILLDVLFRVFRFSKASFCALTSSFTAF